MSKRVKVAFALAAAAAGAALLIPACESVPLTAAPGTTMTLIANPEFVIANGGVSVVTAVLVEPAGTFVPDGTEIFCFTNLGRVDASAKTVNGVARVNFVSDARSGKATVTCVSGGQLPAVSPSASPSPSGRSGVTASAVTPGPAPRVVAASDIAAAAAGENSASVDISIGSALPDRVLLTADPQVLANARSSALVANVFDQFGNPVQNVPVIFSAASGGGTTTTPAPALTEVLGSGGTPTYTDANGRAFDTLRSKAANGTSSKTVVVTATTANGKDDTVDVTVFYSTGR